MAKLHYLYLITRSDGEKYVGVTNNIHKRSWQHKNGYGSKYLQGKNFTLEILQEGSEEYIYSIEDSYIIQHNASLNIAKGGYNAGGLKGSVNGRSIITEDDVPGIQQLLSEGWIQQDIANQYGISRATVSNIARKTGWIHALSNDIEVESKRKMVPLEIRRSIRTMRESGREIAEIAKELDIKYATVYSHCRDVVTTKNNTRKLSEEKIQEIISLRQSGLSWAKIAAKAKVGQRTARKYCGERL